MNKNTPTTHLFVRDGGLPDADFVPTSPTTPTMEDGWLSDPYYVCVLIESRLVPLPIAEEMKIPAAIAAEMAEYISAYNKMAEDRGQEYRYDDQTRRAIKKSRANKR